MRQHTIMLIIILSLTSPAQAGLNLGAGPDYPLMFTMNPQFTLSYPHVFMLGTEVSIGTQYNGSFRALSVGYDHSFITSTNRLSLGLRGSWFVFDSDISYLHERRSGRDFSGVRLQVGVTNLAYARTSEWGFFKSLRMFLGLATLANREEMNGLVELGIAFPLGWRRAVKDHLTPPRPTSPRS